MTLQDLTRERDSQPSWFWTHPPARNYAQLSNTPAVENRGTYKRAVRITDKQVQQIRKASGPLKDIAAKYGCSISWVWKVRHGQKRVSA